METTRFVLLIALGLVLTMLWQAWQEDYGNIVIEQQADTSVPETPVEPANNSFPEIKAQAPDENVEQSVVPSENENQFNSGSIINVKTDVLDLEINSQGGTIQRATLLSYPVSKKENNGSVVLLKNEENGFYLVQGGLLSEAGQANHKTVYRTEKELYELNEAESLSVPLVWESEEGLRVIKTLTFYKSQYIVDVRYEIQNDTSETWAGSAYAQINRTQPTEAGSRFIYTYTGAVVSSPEKRYEKIDFADIEENKLAVDITNGWAAMLQHYFVTAIIPGLKEERYHYYSLNPEQRSYVIGAISPSKKIPVGESGIINHRIYTGPKLQKELSNYAEGLELTVDYGVFWFLAKPVFWLLDKIHSVVNNWGWSIVLVTIILKLLFFNLSAAGYRSMANMRRVQPRLLSIRDRYKDDRTRLNQAMMDLYREEKINPLGGCFPILVQIPVFISLYWVLLESVELRQADFILWLNDLSAADPYFVLPLLMGLTMYVQQKLNPAPMDPVQAKVMSFLPIVFTVFFAFFPSGLVLYWVVNNALSIAQQWVITRNLERTGNKTNN